MAVQGSTSESTQPGGNRGWGRLARGAPLAVLLAVLLLILYRLIPILEVFAVAMLVAFVFRSFMYWLGKLGIPHKLGAIIVILAMVVAVVVFWIAVVPSIIQESSGLFNSLRNSMNSFSSTIENLHDQYSFIPDISSQTSNLTGKLQGRLSGMLDKLPNFVSTTATLLVWAVAGLVMFIYMAYDPGSLVRGAERLVPQSKRSDYRELLNIVGERLRGWIIGTILDMLIIGVGAAIGLTILDVPLAIAFGIIAGLLNVIPFFGSIVGALLPAIVALTISPLKALLVIVLFIILNQIEGHVVQPLVVGPRVHLHPVVVIAALLVAEALLGYIGLLLALPLTAVIVAVLDEVMPEHSPDIQGAKEVQEGAHKPDAELDKDGEQEESNEQVEARESD